MTENEFIKDLNNSKAEFIKNFKDIRTISNNIFNDLPCTKEVKYYYSKILNEANKQKEIDATNPQTRKHYLALKKLVKHKGNVSINILPGYFDEKSPFLGEHSQFYIKLEENNSPNLENFTKSIYTNANSNARFFMIPKEDKEQADALADEMLKKELDKYNTTSEAIFDPPLFANNVTYCYDSDTRYDDWKLRMILNREIPEGYCPFAIIKLHELGHVRQMIPGISNKLLQKRKFVELAPTIDLIVRQDEIYKTLHNIPLKEEISYPKKIIFNNSAINLGEIANTFRKIKATHNFDNFEQVMLTPEVEAYIKSHTPHKVPLLHTSHTR